MQRAFVPNPDVLHRRVGNDLVLVHMKTNQIYALNETGGRFWELFVDGVAVAEIAVRISDCYDVDPAELEAEIKRLLADLERQDLVRAT